MSEEGSFSYNKEIIQSIAQEAIKQKLDGQIYKGDSIKEWAEGIVKSILEKLTGEKFQPFKYLANCMILSKRSNGVHTLTMSLWDPQNDGSATVQWSNESMQCIVTIWGMKY